MARGQDAVRKEGADGKKPRGGEVGEEGLKRKGGVVDRIPNGPPTGPVLIPESVDLMRYSAHGDVALHGKRCDTFTNQLALSSSKRGLSQ